MSCRRTSLARPAPTLQVCSGRIGDPILAFRTLGRIAALVMSQRRTSYADQTEHLLDREAVRGPDQFGAALLRAGGEQFERASVVRVAPAWAGGGSVWSSLALRAAAPAFPERGNSRSPSPSFCSPVIGPLNLSSAASRTRFIPNPCAGRWNVPGFGSRAGARNCSVGSRSCMASLSRQREHSGNGQGRTRAPPAAYQFDGLQRAGRRADGPRTAITRAKGAIL
jgi:hypothetical protein